MSVVPATTDVEKFEPSADCVSGRLLTVARLVEKKGHEYAIDAVAQFVEQGYDVKYHIVGSGERGMFVPDAVSLPRSQSVDIEVPLAVAPTRAS